MVAPVTKRRSRKPIPDWHAQFLDLLPAIRSHARFGISDGRVSQICSELLTSWRRFVGEAAPPEAPASAA